MKASYTRSNSSVESETPRSSSRERSPWRPDTFVSTIEVPVGEATTVGSLAITVRACDKRPPEETPESAAFLEIVENRPNEAPQSRFAGWMFASSPALNALEHPVYDVWVIDCVNAATTESETSP